MRTTAFIATIAATSIVAPLADAEIDDKAQQTLDAANAFYADLDAVSVEYTTTTTMAMGGMQQDQTLAVTVKHKSPTKFHMRTANDQLGELSIVSDGSSLSTYMDSSYTGGKVYTTADAPESFAKLLQDNADIIGMSFGTAGIDAVSMTLNFLAGDPNNELADSLESATFVGTETVRGVETNHIDLVFSTEIVPGQSAKIPVSVWIEQGDEAWIRRVEPDLQKMFASMPQGGGLPPGATVTAVQTLEEASRSPVFNADTFAFSAPDGAREVTSLFDAMRETAQQAQGQQQQDPAEALVGKPAPAFNLDLLTGGSVNLAQHKGKDVVVLDFWATWCGPCIRAMPTIISTTKKFEDQNVVLYAVNLREDNAKIEAFLKQRGFDTKVLLDRDGSVATAYGARAIPQTVIIGKDGTVQAVHVGMLPNLEQQLTSELEKVTAGENLY